MALMAYCKNTMTKKRWNGHGNDILRSGLTDPDFQRAIHYDRSRLPIFPSQIIVYQCVLIYLRDEIMLFVVSVEDDHCNETQNAASHMGY